MALSVDDIKAMNQRNLQSSLKDGYTLPDWLKGVTSELPAYMAADQPTAPQTPPTDPFGTNTYPAKNPAVPTNGSVGPVQPGSRMWNDTASQNALGSDSYKAAASESIPREAYLQAKGIPALGRRWHQEWMADEYGKAKLAYELMGIGASQGMDVGSVPENFIDFYNRYDPMAVRKLLGSMNQSYMSAPVASQGFLDDLTEDQMTALVYGGAQKYGAPGAAYIGSNTPELISQWKGSSGYLDEAQSFATFLRQKYGL